MDKAKVDELIEKLRNTKESTVVQYADDVVRVQTSGAEKQRIGA